MKPWHEKPLHDKIYLESDGVYMDAIRIIGYAGTTPIAFYDAAKKLKNYEQYRYERAVADLTVYARRQPPILRLELTPKARKLARVILGAPPEDPLYREWWTARLLSNPDAQPPVPLEPATKPAKQPAARRRRKTS